MQSGSKKVNKGSTLDVLRCTHSQTRRAATRRLIFLHKKPGASLSKDAVCKGMLLSFSMLAIQFPSDKFETRDITAAACISQLAKVISSLQSNNQYDAGRTWKFSLLFICEPGGRNNWRTNGSAHKKCIFPPAASGARRASEERRASNNLGNNLPH
jgi:hypothetical protein